MQGLTLVRTLIQLYVMPDDIVTEVDGRQKVAIGIQTVSQEAFAAAVVPDPETVDDYPERGWVYRTHVPTSVSLLTILPATEIKADIRSQRKIDDSELIYTI